MTAKNTYQMPNDTTLEMSVLGSILTYPRCMYEIAPVLKEEMFFSRQNEIVYRAIRKIDAEGRGIDLFTVSEELKKTGEIDDKNIMEYLIYLTGQCVSTSNVYEHAMILRSYYKRREMIRIGEDFQRLGYDCSADFDDVLQKADSELYAISVDDNRQTVERLDGIMEDVMMSVHDASMNGGIVGLESGLVSLDKVTGGWRNNQFVVVAARPAMGKTSFLLTMAKNIAGNGNPVLLFSLEMSKLDLGQRLLSMASEISVSKINGQEGKVNIPEKMILERQSELLAKIPLFIDDASNLTMYELASKARQKKREQNIKCVMIDYLQLLSGNGKYGTREQEVSSISRALKQLAKELDIPVIALSQLNRGVEARSGENKRPQLSDLRESGAIEQDSDMVIFIHRPEYYGIDMYENGESTKGKAEIIIAKNRGGAVRTLKMQFHSKFTKFTDTNNMEENEEITVF